MTKDQIQALVNKGTITHVGIAADLEKMTDEEICNRYVTRHENAAEILVGENSKEDITPNDVMPEVPAEAPEEPTSEPEVQVMAEESPVEVVEAPVEPKKSSKKSSKKNEAPVVDPVE